MEYTDHVAEDLAEDAAGDWGHEAAVWLLTEHRHWLPELARTDLIAHMSPDDSSHWVRLNWSRVASECLLRPDGQLIGTASEWQVLAVACSLTGRHALSWGALSSLDETNRRRVLRAIAWAAGGREYAESLGLLADAEAPGDAPDELTRLRARVAELDEDVAKLRALEAAGVDNWGGYGHAMSILHDED